MIGTSLRSAFNRLRRSKIQAALRAVQGFQVSTFERCAAAFESRVAAIEHRTQ